MRVLAACSLGGVGHLEPLLPFLAAAERRGDETLVVGPAALQEMVELSGYHFEAGGEPPESAVAPIRERLPVAPPGEASVLGNRDLFARLAAAALLPAMEQICVRWEPNFILREPCEYASAVVAGRLGIPAAQVAISLAAVKAGSIAVAASALEDHRSGLVDELHASPYLTRFPASLDPSPFPTTVRFHDADASREPLPSEWWPGSDAPLVYLTFGTVLGRMSIAAEVYRAALQAVATLDVRVLLTVGRHFDRASLGAVPPNVHVEAWVRQRDVFEEAAVVVCHGGSGTVFGALAAGLPLVVIPVFADQFGNGRRVAEAGAARMVVASPDPAGPRRVVGDHDAPRITEAVDAVLATSAFRSQARRIAAEIAATPTVDDALDATLTAGGRSSGWMDA